MSESRYELERPVRCRNCEAYTKTIVLRIDALTVDDPRCPLCAQGGCEPLPKRGRDLGPTGRANRQRRKRRGPETLVPEALN